MIVFFFKIVAPDLMLMDYQYLWAVTESEAVEKGLTKEYYKRVKKEISDTNEAIKKRCDERCERKTYTGFPGITGK